MEPVGIELKENPGIARIGEPVSVGLPLARGTIRSSSTLALSCEDTQQNLLACFTPLCYWPDGSIRWLLCEFEADLPANTSQTLIVSDTKTPSDTDCCVAAVPEGWQINTDRGHLLLQPGLPAWEYSTHGPSTITEARLTDENGDSCQAVADCDWRLQKNSPLFIEASLSGQWLRPDGSALACFHCSLRISRKTGLVTADVQVHNPNRARHPGGLWDLGDEGAVLFRSLELVTTPPEADTACLRADAVNPNNQTITAPDISLYQDSSGGENWNSANHVDRYQALTTHFQGYQLSGNNEKKYGKRANPLLTVTGAGAEVQIAMPGFWQNFPSSLSYHEGTAVAGLFPKQPDDQLYELQGGERKTLRCLIGYHESVGDLAWAYSPLTPVLSPATYEQGQAFPWFTTENGKDPLAGLINEGLNGSANFFAKREIIDEYGWRNFGDIFADHESLYQPEGQPPLISHYNNQYDALYGFARRFAATRDPRWHELMNDLAAHVTDIDIYHTTQDRAEYNNGLFWHTDHYLPVQTATHRTFSCHNNTSSTPGQTGGGPAAEHCYTTGLLYHYLMTGKVSSRQAVLELADWMVQVHEGSGGFLEQLLAVKKQEFPKFKALLKRQYTTRHRYPFTRGTGNYLNALLDAHILEPGRDWRERTGQVIENSFHPADNIETRNLLERRTGWHYLVLLDSLARYLWLSNKTSSHDLHYQYALSSFRHYTRWMLDHELPFLDYSEQLEFDNDTWVAQDIRKAMLMYQAACFDPEHKGRYVEKARELLEYVISTLENSAEQHFSRIQIILLQNHGPHLASVTIPEQALQTDLIQNAPLKPPTLLFPELGVRVMNRLFWGIRTFRPTRERAWLSTRLERR